MNDTETKNTAVKAPALMSTRPVTAQDALKNLSKYLKLLYGKKVLIFLDEYDTPMQEAYIHGYWDEFIGFMRGLFNAAFKTNPYLERAIMTGITRVSKESIFSDLNNLVVVTTTSNQYETAFGFTEEEVKELSGKYNQNYEKVKKWYDGYWLNDYQVYNPKAVVSVMLRGEFKSYWSETASYETVVPLINMDFDGLRSAIIEMLSGDSVSVDVTTFQNDMTSFSCRDDVITCLIHFGYLGYNQIYKKAFVPNEDIRQELLRIMRRK